VGCWRTRCRSLPLCRRRWSAGGTRSGIGLLCAVELWLATVVFDVQGLKLAVIVAASTGTTGALVVGYWLFRRQVKVASA